MEWFLHETDLRHEIVNQCLCHSHISLNNVFASFLKPIRSEYNFHSVNTIVPFNFLFKLPLVSYLIVHNL